MDTWSLNRLPINPRAQDALTALGRGLHIATRFEEKCKYLLAAAKLSEAYESAAPVEDFDEFFARLPKAKMLNETVKGLVGAGPLTEAETTVLHTARQARNYFAHEAAGFEIHSVPAPTLTDAIRGKTSYNLGSLTNRMIEARHQLRLLSKGDNLVSRWCYYLQEGAHEAPPALLMASYEGLVDRWVFDPVWDLLPFSEEFDPRLTGDGRLHDLPNDV